MENSSLSSSSSSSPSAEPLPSIPGGTESNAPFVEPPPVDNDHVAPGCEKFGPSVFESLPQYQSHKIVRAAKIAKIEQPEGARGFSVLLLDCGDVEIPVTMSPDWMDKHAPEVGGYIVAYPDGYVSYSPSAPFEIGYTPVPEPLPPTTGGELSPATPVQEQVPHLECRALIMEELKRLGDLLNKSGAITAAELAESKIKHIIARYL